MKERKKELVEVAKNEVIEDVIKAARLEKGLKLKPEDLVFSSEISIKNYKNSHNGISGDFLVFDGGLKVNQKGSNLLLGDIHKICLESEDEYKEQEENLRLLEEKISAYEKEQDKILSSEEEDELVDMINKIKKNTLDRIRKRSDLDSRKTNLNK